MAGASNQQLIRDIINLFMTRGLRHAVHDGAVNTDSFKIYAHSEGNLAAPSAGTQRIIVDFATADLTDLDEKGFGSIHPHVPDPARQ